jgi:Flp pilus assembly protein TadG
MALELAIVTPVVIVMLMVVVAFGRITHGRQLVEDAAAAGSRAAALAQTPGEAQAQAQSTVTSTLVQAGVSCTSTTVSVDTSAFRAGGEVDVRVRCVADLGGLSMTGLPGSMTLTAAAVTPLEKYRDFTP